MFKMLHATLVEFVSFLQDPETIFWITALGGTIMFVLKSILFFSGLGVDDQELDVGIDGDFGDADFSDVSDAGDVGDHHPDSMQSFKLVTLHTLTGFFMMFGWIGLACWKQFGCSAPVSLLLAFCAGFALMLVTALVFRGALLLQSSGATFESKNTIGLTGTVYQKIQADGAGKIQVVVDGLTRELLARSVDRKAIDSFVVVKIIGVISNRCVLVKRMK